MSLIKYKRNPKRKVTKRKVTKRKVTKRKVTKRKVSKRQRGGIFGRNIGINYDTTIYGSYKKTYCGERKCLNQSLVYPYDVTFITMGTIPILTCNSKQNNICLSPSNNFESNLRDYLSPVGAVYFTRKMPLNEFVFLDKANNLFYCLYNIESSGNQLKHIYKGSLTPEDNEKLNKLIKKENEMLKELTEDLKKLREYQTAQPQTVQPQTVQPQTVQPQTVQPQTQEDKRENMRNIINSIKSNMQEGVQITSETPDENKNKKEKYKVEGENYQQVFFYDAD